MESSGLQIEQAQAVVTVTLNRPDRRNAFDGPLVAALEEVFTRLAADPSARVVVVAGAGPAFCAGADLDWMARMAAASPEENREDARALQRMLAALDHCPQVTLARVQGAALGGGIGLAAACDLVVAAEDARFAFSEARLGLAPAVIAPYVLRRIGPGAARALFVTGERFSAAEAHRLGLVHEVVPAAGLDAAVQRQTAQALRCGPEAVAAIKQLLRRLADVTPEESAALTVECLAALRAGPEAQEGLRAFREKRPPAFAPEEAGRGEGEKG